MRLPKAPKTRPRTPKTRPRGPQESPRAPQDLPNASKIAPRRPPKEKIAIFFSVHVTDLRLQRSWRLLSHVFLRFSSRRLLENIEKTMVFPRFFRCSKKTSLEEKVRKNLEKYASGASQTLPGPLPNPPKSSPKRSEAQKKRPRRLQSTQVAANERPRTPQEPPRQPRKAPRALQSPQKKTCLSK